MAGIGSHVYVYRCKPETVVRIVYGNSSCFEVKVGMHHGLALSPLLFVIAMEAISREFTVALPWELLYAGDLAVIAETEKDLSKRLNEWKDNVENKSMGVNMNKTKVITRMWANAQPDGRPAEHRWRPLFNAAKFS